jgi:hypothetical protein
MWWLLALVVFGIVLLGLVYAIRERRNRRTGGP